MTRSRGRGVLPALLVSALAAALPRPAAGQCGPCPAPSFDRTPRGFYNVFGSLQDELARADLDRDGNLDLIVGNIGFPSGVAVFRGSPNGTFSAPTVFEPQNPGDSIGVADFDLDGLLDVVVTGFNQQQFAWVKGTGDGAFEAPVFIMLDTVVNRLAAGDFNGDGRPDVALLVYTGNQVQLRFGDGAGGFPSFVNLPVGPSATSLVVADLDGNDFGDLVVPNNGSNTVSVILGRPSLLFPPPRNFFAGTNPRGAVAADFDGDGIPDLGVAISQFMTEAQGVSILKGNGAGEFGSPTFVFSPHGRIVAGHFDGNATTDLVVYGFDRIARLLGDGHGGFSVTVAEGVEAPVLVAGDLNRDGIDDLVGRFGGAFAALLSSPGVLELPRFFEHVAGSPTAVGDLDGDGIADLAVSRFSGQIAILESNGAGGWTPGTALQLTSTPRSLLAADVNSDSKIDLIATAASAVVVFLASGGGAFGAGTPYNVSGGPTSVAAGRLDGDSNADLVVTLGGDNSLAVLRGTGADRSPRP